MELKYQLDHIERIIADYIINDEINEEKITQTISTVASEVDRIKRAFVTEVYEVDNERQIESYIQYHQKSIIRLADQVYQQLNLNSFLSQKGNGKINFNEGVYAYLDELLNFIEKHFRQFFDQDLTIPHAYWVIATRDIASKIDALNARLETLHDQLRNLLLIPINRILQPERREQITFREIIYGKEILREIQQVINREQDPSDTLWESCVYLNFNSIHSFNYYTKMQAIYIRGLDTVPAQLEHLHYQVKRNNQVQVRPGIAYHDASPSLKTQVVEWLSEEIYYLEKKQQLYQEGRQMAVHRLPKDPKIKIDLSVASLAYILKLLLDNKIILNQNISEITRMLTRTFKTKRSETISDESLRLKYYNVESGTKETVRGLLQLLIKNISGKV